MHTTDGGETWEVQVEDIWAGAGQDVDFINESVGWIIVGDNVYIEHAYIWHTSDGGATWEQTKLKTFPIGVDFVDENIGWIVGAGTIMHTSNGGETWEWQTEPSFHLNDVAFVNDNLGWAVGNGIILHTSDGGLTWNEQETLDLTNFQAVTFVNANEGWAVGESKCILHTSDGGTTWECQAICCHGSCDVTFVNESLGWIVGNFVGSFILYTSDGGETWELQNNPTSEKTLHSVVFIDENLGWAVGDDGTIIHTSNGGDTWEIQNSLTAQKLNSATFVDENMGWAVGDAGDILHTSDGGENWTQQTSGTSNSLNSVYFVSSSEGWAVSSDGTILHTSDGGQNWTQQVSGVSNGLYDICYDGAITMWVVGDWGIILKYTDSSLPVELSSFTAEATTDDVILHWRTATEINNLGFNIYRSNTKDGKHVKINARLIAGAGTDATPHDYSFTDENVVKGFTYYYYIEDVDFTGKTDKSHIIEVTVGKGAKPILLTPPVFALLQNFPNPFNPETWIPYQLAETVPVTIRIFDPKGQIIRTLYFGNQQAGSYATKDKAVYWDGKNDFGERVSSGVYFYQLQAGKFSTTRKMTVIK